MAAFRVGVIRADGRSFRVRHVAHGADHARLATDLAAIWRLTFHRNTRAMAEALLSRDWIVLGRHLPPWAAHETGGNPAVLAVDGVGVAVACPTTLPVDGDIESEPPSHMTSMYLLDAVGRARLFTYTATPDWHQTTAWHLRDIALPPTA